MPRSIAENSESQSESICCDSDCDCLRSVSKSLDDETSFASKSPTPTLPKPSVAKQRAGYNSEKRVITSKPTSRKPKYKSEANFSRRFTKDDEKEISTSSKKVKETNYSPPPKAKTKIKNQNLTSDTTSSFRKGKTNVSKKGVRDMVSTLRTLDEEYDESSAIRSRNRSVSSGSELGSDFYVEKPAVKKVKNETKSKTLKKRSTEGKDMIRFTKGELSAR